MRSKFAIVLWVLLMISISGCAVSYRHQTHKEVIVNGDREVTVKGDTDLSSMGLLLDFLYFRMVLPITFQQTDLELKDNDGGVDGIHVETELKMYRLEVPFLSIWNAGERFKIRYPGELRKRKSIELWANVDSNLNKHNTAWYTDIGLVYYHYRIFAAGLHVGYGHSHYTGATQGVGRPAWVWDVKAPSWGVGFEITLFAGELGLEFLEFLFEKDVNHRENYRK